MSCNLIGSVSASWGVSASRDCHHAAALRVEVDQQCASSGLLSQHGEVDGER
jgi:hypothetical protein